MALLLPLPVLLLLLPPVLLPPPPPENGERGVGGGAGRDRGRARPHRVSLVPIGSPRTPFALIGWAPRAPLRAGSPQRGARGSRGVPPPRASSAAARPAAPLPACPPGRFQCGPGAACFPREWRCDGHPDCEDEEDELGCGTANPADPAPDGVWVTPPRSSAALPAGSVEASATPVPGGSAPLRSQGRTWILIIAALLSILVAVGSVAVWGLSKAKSRSDIFSLERASREELMPDKSQTGSFP
ncbi:CD320 antigen [Theristicus caerulescens]